MKLMLAAIALAMTPPPEEGDERTAILASVNALIDALSSSDHEAADALLESEGSMVIVTVGAAGKISQRIVPFAELRRPDDADRPVMVETLGIPTLLQRGPIAHVWVPYRFSISGKLSHCGIDAFTLVKRDDRWRVANLVYTVENIDQCRALGAPESDG